MKRRTKTDQVKVLYSTIWTEFLDKKFVSVYKFSVNFRNDWQEIDYTESQFLYKSHVITQVAALDLFSTLWTGEIPLIYIPSCLQI